MEGKAASTDVLRTSSSALLRQVSPGQQWSIVRDMDAVAGKMAAEAGSILRRPPWLCAHPSENPGAPVARWKKCGYMPWNSPGPKTSRKWEH